ncbi:MAG TPA: hypothetical protein VGK13_03260 [Methanocellaceae archaeon]
MQLISYTDDVGNLYWMVYDPCYQESQAELNEISEKGWDVKVQIEDIDVTDLELLKDFLDQYFR